jgi:hypothetical protein
MMYPKGWNAGLSASADPLSRNCTYHTSEDKALRLADLTGNSHGNAIAAEGVVVEYGVSCRHVSHPGDSTRCASSGPVFRAGDDVVLQLAVEQLELL